MATKTNTTAPVSPPQSGVNRPVSSVNQHQSQRPQSGTRQPDLSDQSQDQNFSQEQNRQYSLATVRSDRAKLQNAEQYRSHFQKSSGFLWTVAYGCAVIDYILGLIEDTLVGAPVVVISIALDGISGYIALRVSRKMTSMHNSMEAMLQGIDASAQKTENRRAAQADYQQFAFAMASSRQNGGKTSNRSVKNGAKSFLGKMIGSDLMDIVPYANLWPWQFRTTQKMHKHEKAMIEEGLALVDEYEAAVAGEIEATNSYITYLNQEEAEEYSAPAV